MGSEPPVELSKDGCQYGVWWAVLIHLFGCLQDEYSKTLFWEEEEGEVPSNIKIYDGSTPI